MSFFAYIAAHPFVGVVLVVLILLTVFVWIKAILASKKRNDEREKIIANLEKEKALRNEFRHPDSTTFAEGKDNLRLILGLCANVQMSIEKKGDMTAAFWELSEVKRYAYCIGYVFEDSEKKLSEFFRSNGEPLLSVAKEAVDSIIGGDFAEIFDKEFIMLDDNDETTSVDNDKLAEYDSRYAEIMYSSSDKIYAKFADYLRKNQTEFI